MADDRSNDRSDDRDVTEIDPAEIDSQVELMTLAESLREELITTRLDRDEYLAHLQRLQADFENAWKRMIREQIEVVERAGKQVLEQLLPVLDSFDLALNVADADDPMRSGVESVGAQLLDVLGKQGVERLDSVGDRFDPALHEAVAHDPGEGALVVREVMRPGYLLKGHLLRPAMVRVGADPDLAEAPDLSDEDDDPADDPAENGPADEASDSAESRLSDNTDDTEVGDAAAEDPAEGADA